MFGLKKDISVEDNEYANYLLRNGWRMTLCPAGNLFSLTKMPTGLMASTNFANLKLKDAKTVQECMEKLLALKSGPKQ